MRGAGRVVFVAILLLIVGTLNIIYGIGALADANFYANDTRYILTNLHTMGWVLIILGVIQLTGGFSLMAGNAWGRIVGVIAGSLGAIGALLSMGGSPPVLGAGHLRALRLDRLRAHHLRSKRGRTRRRAQGPDRAREPGQHGPGSLALGLISR